MNGSTWTPWPRLWPCHHRCASRATATAEGSAAAEVGVEAAVATAATGTAQGARADRGASGTPRLYKCVVPGDREHRGCTNARFLSVNDGTGRSGPAPP